MYWQLYSKGILWSKTYSLPDHLHHNILPLQGQFFWKNFFPIQLYYFIQALGHKLTIYFVIYIEKIIKQLKK